MQSRRCRWLAVALTFHFPALAFALGQRPSFPQRESAAIVAGTADSSSLAAKVDQGIVVSKASNLLTTLLAQGPKTSEPDGVSIADGRAGQMEEDITRQDQLDALLLAQAVGSRQDQVENLVSQEAETVRAQEKALEAVVLRQAAALNGSVLTDVDTHPLKMFISCYTFASPCGDVVLRDTPVDMRTPFGSFMLRAGNETRSDVERVDRQFSNFVYWGCWAGVLIAILYNASTKKRRERVRLEFKHVYEGNLTPDETIPKEELEKELENRKNPAALYFIAPGNVYRLLAIMHPGVVGWPIFRQLAVQAAVCAFMQFYLPFCFTRSVLKKWQYAGIKSPLWYMQSPVEITAMICLIGALSLVMGGRIREHMVVGAEANYYIMTHHKPAEEEEDKELENMAAQRLPSGVKRQERAKITEEWIDKNELFWCTASTLLDIVVSLLSQTIFILEVGTTEIDDVQKIVTISIALIFIFEIDDKMMDIDPRNRTRYRREVLRSKIEDEAEPTWIKSMAAVAVWMSWLVNIIGFFGYIFFRWRNRDSGYEIGAAPLSH